MPKQRMTPSEAFVETLVAQGVTNVFGIVGSAYMDALDLFPTAGIRFVPTVHEQGAAHMADGFSRVSGKHGVCIAQNGPGITNFVTAIAAAYWAHSPVVAITPEAGSLGVGLGGFQETDQLPIFSRITKYQAHVNAPARMAELTARAFDRAHLELGPTQLNIPRDYFYGEIECEIPAPLKISRGPGSAADLDAAARALADARFPVIVAGGGVVMSNGTAALIALAEQLGAPVVSSYLHNDSFPASHALACGPLGYHGSKAAMRVIAQADVVLALGSRLGPFGTLPQYGFDYWPGSAKLVQVDADPRVLGLVKKTHVAVCGDAREAAEALTARLFFDLRGPSRWPLDTPVLDPWVAITAMATVTKRVRFLPSVLRLAIRQPLLEAKALCSVAAMSNDRVALGVGLARFLERCEPSRLHQVLGLVGPLDEVQRNPEQLVPRRVEHLPQGLCVAALGEASEQGVHILGAHRRDSTRGGEASRRARAAAIRAWRGGLPRRPGHAARRAARPRS